MNSDGWIFQIAPIPGESFGHYIGRFRRANCLSQIALAALVSVDVRLARGWEKPSLWQPLSPEQSAKLSALLGLSEAQLTEMQPGVRSRLHLATRLCPQCYGDMPIHRTDWQRAGVDHCDCHHQLFLSDCPACRTMFRVPALWESGCCEQCWLPFQQMSLSCSQSGQTD